MLARAAAASTLPASWPQVCAGAGSPRRVSSLSCKRAARIQLLGRRRHLGRHLQPQQGLGRIVGLGRGAPKAPATTGCAPPESPRGRVPARWAAATHRASPMRPAPASSASPCACAASLRSAHVGALQRFALRAEGGIAQARTAVFEARRAVAEAPPGPHRRRRRGRGHRPDRPARARTARPARHRADRRTSSATPGGRGFGLAVARTVVAANGHHRLGCRLRRARAGAGVMRRRRRRCAPTHRRFPPARPGRRRRCRRVGVAVERIAGKASASLRRRRLLGALAELGRRLARRHLLGRADGRAVRRAAGGCECAACRPSAAGAGGGASPRIAPSSRATAARIFCASPVRWPPRAPSRPRAHNGRARSWRQKPFRARPSCD